MLTATARIVIASSDAPVDHQSDDDDDDEGGEVFEFNEEQEDVVVDDDEIECECDEETSLQKQKQQLKRRRTPPAATKLQTRIDAEIDRVATELELHYDIFAQFREIDHDPKASSSSSFAIDSINNVFGEPAKDTPALLHARKLSRFIVQFADENDIHVAPTLLVCLVAAFIRLHPRYFRRAEMPRHCGDSTSGTVGNLLLPLCPSTPARCLLEMMLMLMDTTISPCSVRSIDPCNPDPDKISLKPPADMPPSIGLLIRDHASGRFSCIMASDLRTLCMRFVAWVDMFDEVRLSVSSSHDRDPRTCGRRGDVDPLLQSSSSLDDHPPDPRTSIRTGDADPQGNLTSLSDDHPTPSHNRDPRTSGRTSDADPWVHGGGKKLTKLVKSGGRGGHGGLNVEAALHKTRVSSATIKKCKPLKTRIHEKRLEKIDFSHNPKDTIMYCADASGCGNKGWGGHVILKDGRPGLRVQEKWSPGLIRHYFPDLDADRLGKAISRNKLLTSIIAIHNLEAIAVDRARVLLEERGVDFAGKQVVVVSDNKEVINRINSPANTCKGVSAVVKRLRAALEVAGASVKGFHVYREQNRTADMDSKSADKDGHAISCELFATVDNIHGPHTIDLFASGTNNRLERFCSLNTHDRAAVAHDAFRVDWMRENPWMNPPVGLIDRVLKEIMIGGVKAATLLTPFKPLEPWFWNAAAMSVCTPMFVPASPLNWLSSVEFQEGGVSLWNLMIWRVTGRSGIPGLRNGGKLGDVIWSVENPQLPLSLMMPDGREIMLGFIEAHVAS